MFFLILKLYKIKFYLYNIQLINKMRKNKENFNQQSIGDRFIPTEVRSCAFQLQSSPVVKDKLTNTYQNLLS